MAEVVIQEGESLENALRRFKRKVQSEDIIKEIKKHSYYMKPGEKRRAKRPSRVNVSGKSNGVSRIRQLHHLSPSRQQQSQPIGERKPSSTIQRLERVAVW